MSVFEQYLQTALGWHDGVRVRVQDKVESPLVSIHEAVHERIFAETPDGQVHAVFAGALREGLVCAEDAAAVRQTVEGMFDNSRKAHEVFANYLSIKELPASTEQHYLKELSADYLAFYEQLAELIDEHIPTSFLQYVIGWEFAAAVFSSKLILRTAGCSKGVPLLLKPDERPDVRLELLLGTLRGHEMRQLCEKIQIVAKQTCDQRGMEPWDFLVEEAWVRRTLIDGRYSDASTVEEAVSAELRAWLRERVPFWYLLEEQQQNAFDCFTEMASNRFGMELNNAQGLLGLKSTHISTLRRAVSQSRSRVVNTNPIQLPKGDVAFLKDFSSWQDYEAVGVYSACPPAQASCWMVLFWNQDPENHPAAVAYQYMTKDVGDFLELWSRHHAAGIKVPTITAVVLAIRGIREYPNILKSYPHLLADGIREKVCWYLWNGIFELIHASLNSGQKLSFACIEMEEFAQHYGQPTQLEYDGMAIVAVQTVEEPDLGIFLRAMRHQAFGALSQVIAAAVAEGKAHWIDDEVSNGLVPLCREALGVAETFWDEY